MLFNGSTKNKKASEVLQPDEYLEPKWLRCGSSTQLYPVVHRSRIDRKILFGVSDVTAVSISKNPNVPIQLSMLTKTPPRKDDHDGRPGGRIGI